jgi:taurine dioxygenase
VAWEAGQLVLFDDRITQHYAVDNYDGLPRRLNRVHRGRRHPVRAHGGQSYSIQGDAAHYSPVAGGQAAAAAGQRTFS